MQFNEKLFGLDKGNSFKVWEISAVDGVITIQHGKEGGVMTTRVDEIKKGNQGRSVSEQAVFEAQARVKKQKDKNYRNTKEELEDLPVIAMLAKDYLKAGHQVKLRDGVYISDKLDGVRCIAKRKGNTVTLESRTGQPYNVPHIEQELMSVMQPGDVFDGELYVHGPALQDITSAVKRTDAYEKMNAAYLKCAKMLKEHGELSGNYLEAREKYQAAEDIYRIRDSLEFIVFDIYLPEIEFEDRLADLRDIEALRFHKFTGKVSLIGYGLIDNKEDLDAAHRDAVSRGYEGVMIRTRKGVYESGKRSTDLQKLKSFFEDEFEILDILPNKQDGSCYLVRNALGGNNFTVVMGSMQERVDRLENKELYIGKWITVKYQARYKKTLIPQFPTGVRIREGEVVDGIFVPSE